MSVATSVPLPEGPHDEVPARATSAADIAIAGLDDPITPGVVHFFSPPPEPQVTPQGATVINVGAAPCPAPCTNGSKNMNNKDDDVLLFASFPSTPVNDTNSFSIQMTPQHTHTSSSGGAPVTPVTPAVQTDTAYGSYDGMNHPILMNGSAPPTSTHALYIPLSSSSSSVSVNGVVAPVTGVIATPEMNKDGIVTMDTSNLTVGTGTGSTRTTPTLRPRGLSGANKDGGVGGVSYASAIANWKYSRGPGAMLTTRTPSEGSLAISPITIPQLVTTSTPLLAPTVTTVNGIVVPSTPQPQRMVTTATAELIDLRIKHRFLLRLMKAVHAYGCATHRTESLMRHACDAMGIKGEFCVFPTLMIVSFGAPDGDPAKSITHTFPATGGLNCAKLGEVDDLAQLVGQGGISIEEGEKRLDAIITQKLNPPWLVLLCFGISSASCAAIFFGGGWYDVCISFGLGLIVGLATIIADKWKGLGQLLEFSTSMFVSFFARLITSYIPETCYFANLLSSLVWFLPGLSITLSVAEVSAQSLVSGSARFFYAVVVALQLGFGMALGGGLASFDGESPSNACVKAQSSGDWVTAIFFITCAFSFNILLSASSKQMIPMAVAAAVGFTVATLLSKPLGDDTATMMAALAVGLTGSLYARVTGHQPVITTISGILMLVPGSLGVRGVAAFLDDDVVSGMKFGFNMLVTGMSITIGLMIARMLVFPSKRLRNTDSYI